MAIHDEGDSWKHRDDEAPRPRSFEEQIQELSRARPFEPFTIVMSSGDRLHVTSEFALALGPVTFTVYLPGGGTARLRKKEIVMVEIPEPAA